MDTEFLIWSIEHTAWWAPARLGYTTAVQQAGRYTREEADQIVEDANHHGVLHECKIPVACLDLVPVL